MSFSLPDFDLRTSSLTASQQSSATAAEKELKTLFDKAYQFDSRTNDLKEVNAADAKALRQKLDDFTNKAKTSPLLARAYNQPGIIKYFYLSRPEINSTERGLLYLAANKSPLKDLQAQLGKCQRKENQYLLWLGLERLATTETRQLVKKEAEKAHSNAETPQERLSIENSICAMEQKRKDCQFNQGLSLAFESPDLFDNYDYSFQRKDLLQAYYRRHAKLTPAQKLDPNEILLAGRLGMASFAGRFSSNLDDQQLTKIANAAGSKVSLLGSSPVAWSQIQTLSAPLEIGVDQLPAEWKEKARSIRFAALNNISLWDFLKRYASRIVFSKNIHLQTRGDTKTYATNNPLVKEIYIGIDGLDGKMKSWLEILITIAHEAFHIYRERVVIPQHPELYGNLLLEERNTLLFEAEIIKQIVLMESNRSLQNQTVKDEANLYNAVLLTGLSANLPLGYDLRDRDFLKITLPSDRSSLNQQPGSFGKAYLQACYGDKEGKPKLFAQEILKQDLGIELK